MSTELLNIPNKNKLLIFNENKASAPIVSVIGFGNEKTNVNNSISKHSKFNIMYILLDHCCTFYNREKQTEKATKYEF